MLGFIVFAAPSLTSAAIRVDEITFNISLTVKYTGSGGGALVLVNITFREAETSTWIRHNQSVVNVMKSGQTWYALLTNEQLATIQDVEFSFEVQNTGELRAPIQTRQVIGMQRYLANPI